MTWPRLKKTWDGCFTASIADDVQETEKYRTKEAALGRLCEILLAELDQIRRRPFVPRGLCECRGWSMPTGCPGCGVRSMGG